MPRQFSLTGGCSLPGEFIQDVSDLDKLVCLIKKVIGAELHAAAGKGDGALVSTMTSVPGLRWLPDRAARPSRTWSRDQDEYVLLRLQAVRPQLPFRLARFPRRLRGGISPGARRIAESQPENSNGRCVFRSDMGKISTPADALHSSGASVRSLSDKSSHAE
jgi:hypothetical protein